MLAPKRIYQFILVLLLILTPIFNIGELLIYFTIGYVPRFAASVTPIYIKMIKDIGFSLILIVGIFHFLNKGRILKNRYYVFFMICAVLSAIISFLARQNISMILIGIRWLMPMLVLSVIFWAVDDKFQKKIAIIMMIMTVVGFIFQIYELYAINHLYFGKRNSGFFIMPNTMATFSLIAMYYAYNFYKKGIFRSIMVYFIGPVSVILAASGTSVLTLIIFFCVTMFSRIKQKGLIAAIGVVLVLSAALSLSVLTNRSNIYSSLMVRANIFSDKLTAENLIISSDFGSATNTAVLAKSVNIKSENSFIADSGLTSIICNTGLVSFFIFLTFVLSYARKKLIYFQFLFIFLLFMSTNILFETFPINLLFIVNISYFYWLNNNLKKAREENAKISGQQIIL